ncbi:hypothetical protein [Ochrobactrum sp. BTU2]|uniref:hypothetical protein n=1 Tax=Ochrobactrum sp. BTU2 TaxID=2856166 RepID=UPI00211A8236|nr:hypothetical protein [Ochrobactrum sp. BTU2]MCQ9147738.1 hypothetical protein [Ochrobactrum sp. BTU2]
MTDDLPKAVRAVAKGSGWSVKRDILSKRVNDHALAIHPRRGARGIIEFRAKPIAWDHLLWSILQIKGNEKQPISFHFIGAFTCDTPALLQETVDPQASNTELAQQMVHLSERCLQLVSTWQSYDLLVAIEEEQPQEPYRYHITRVLDQICSGNRQAAHDICEAARAGRLDIRRSFSSVDELTSLDSNGRRPSLTFFQLAKLWMSRH